MKKILFVLSYFLLMTSFVAAQDIHFVHYESGDAKDAKSEAEKIGAAISQSGENTTEWNYGFILKGSSGYRYFKFINKGDAPLVIEGAKPSCGCTVPSYPKEPIMPGATGYIKVKYDTNRVGNFSKYITITTNAIPDDTIRLKIIGKVVEVEP